MNGNKEDTVLPMMYMDDAVRATIELMEAEKEKIKIRTSYNLTAISFSAEELSNSVMKYVDNFKCTFTPDERQKIADSWPKTIDDVKPEMIGGGSMSLTWIKFLLK